MNAYREELDRQAAAWKRKPALRALYGRWFDVVARALAPLRPTLELGCGCGALRDRLGALGTDVMVTPWCDLVADARRLPVATGTLGNVVAFDVLHHVPTPLDVLREAARALRPGGRLVLVEPYASPFARLVYGLVHHEPIDLAYDVVRPPPDAGPPGSFANMGIARLVFDGCEPWREAAPELRLVERRELAGITYPLVGGYSYPSVVPAPLVGPLSALEDRLLAGRAGRLLALRVTVVLERAP